MSNLSDLVAFFGYGIYLLVWESLDLMCFSLTNSFWTTCIFVSFGSSLLITGTLALLWPEKGSEDGDYDKKQVLRAILNNPNHSSALYLNKMHGKSIVDFPVKENGNPQSIIIYGASVFEFYNAKASNENVVEYQHGNKRYCAFPIIALTYQNKNITGFWTRCQIPRKTSCQNIYTTDCINIIGKPISIGRRVDVKEEREFREQLRGRGNLSQRSILIDTHNIDISLWGLWYYTLNLIWLIPTSITLIYVSKIKNRTNKE